MNTYGGLEAELHLRTFLTPALDEFEWSSPCPRRLNPGTRTRTQTIRGCVVPDACRMLWKKSHIPAAAETQKRSRLPRSQITILNSYSSCYRIL